MRRLVNELSPDDIKVIQGVFKGSWTIQTKLYGWKRLEPYL